MSFDIPDELSGRLETDPDSDLQQGHIVEVLHTGGRPYYNIKHIENKLDYEFDRDAIRDRLNEMTEVDVLRRERVNDGDVWWINHPESNWPIPPDAAVTSASAEPTVSQFLTRPHVALGTTSALVAVVGSVLVWMSGSLGGPLGASSVSSTGLSLVSVAYLGLIAAGMLWVVRKTLFG